MNDDELLHEGTPMDAFWVWARTQSKQATPRVGKWMLWPSDEEVATIWHQVYELSQREQSGVIQAKVSRETNRMAPNTRLICVYTADSDDKEDLQRVVTALRMAVNPAYVLLYKENRVTRAGLYQNAFRPVSKWRVRPYETTILAVKGYQPFEEEHHV